MNERRKNILIGVLLVGLVTISVAYAALNQTLNINGTAKVASGNWNVHFASVTSGETVTSGYASTSGSLTVTSDEVTTPTVLLKAPGDSVTFYFDVKNEGAINAKLTNYQTISKGTPEYTAGGTMSAADLAIANAVTVSLTYADGTAIAVNSDTLANTTGVAHMKLTITLPSSVNSLPSKEISFPSISAIMTYSQN